MSCETYIISLYPRYKTIKSSISQKFNREKSDELRKNITALWECYFLPADSDQDGSVQYLELLDYMKSVSHLN